MSLSQIGSYQAASAFTGTSASSKSAGRTDGQVTDTAQAATASPVNSTAPVQAASAITENPSAADNARLDQAVASINRFIKPVNSRVEFSVDEDSGRTVVQVIDTDTKDLLRQFPSKEALAISQELDRYQGILLKDKA
jgi:flagellar protein FlaG